MSVDLNRISIALGVLSGRIRPHDLESDEQSLFDLPDDLGIYGLWGEKKHAENIILQSFDDLQDAVDNLRRRMNDE